VWARFASEEAAHAARQRQKDVSLRWRVRVLDAEPPWALVLFRYLDEVGDPMATKMEPGPLRDLLGLIVQATRGGDSVDTHYLCERTGVGFIPTRQRLETLRSMGVIERALAAGVPRYVAVLERAEALLG
jgi:hypothetical protein